jgi:hypothetical protein
MTEPESTILDEIAAIPLDDIFDAIGRAPGKPDNLWIGLLQLRAGEAAPRLLEILRNAAAGKPLGEPEEQLLFYGLHVLGAARNTDAFAPLLRLLRLPGDDLDYLLGDAITASLPKIAAGVFDGSAAALFATIGDVEIDPFARNALLGAATFLTWDGKIDPAEMRGFLERFDDERLAGDRAAEILWDTWYTAIALLGWRDMTPRVEAAFRDGRALEEIATIDFYLNDLARAEAEPEDPARFVEADLGYIEDVAEALEWVGSGGPHDDSVDSSPEPDAPAYEPIAPYINPFRHVGRNDPCPCGSGKKAKKCCLATV